jgi:hypothetical protein
MTPAQAYSIEKRLSDMRREVRRAYEGGWLPRLRPGYFAGTFGVTKEQVKEAIRAINEIAGSAK